MPRAVPALLVLLLLGSAACARTGTPQVATTATLTARQTAPGALSPTGGPPAVRPPATPSVLPGATASPTTTAAAVNPCTADLTSFSFVFVTSPTAGARVRSPFTVTGCANVFEANVNWRLVELRGATINQGHTTASCGTGCIGDFRFPVTFPAGERRVATLEVFERSAADGSVRNLNSIPLVLEP